VLRAAFVGAADPSTDEARRLLTRELSRAAYHQEPLVDRILRWINERLDALLAGPDAAGAGWLSPWVTALVGLLVVGLIAFVVPKVQRERRAPADDAVLADLATSAAQYRQRAAAAVAAGDFGAALLNGFRAIARDMAGRAVLDDAPGRTAHEVGLALAPVFPEHADDLTRAATLFDAVRYGGQLASRPEAEQVLDLDRVLAAARPRFDPVRVVATLRSP